MKKIKELQNLIMNNYPRYEFYLFNFLFTVLLLDIITLKASYAIYTLLIMNFILLLKLNRAFNEKNWKHEIKIDSMQMIIDKGVEEMVERTIKQYEKSN